MFLFSRIIPERNIDRKAASGILQCRERMPAKYGVRNARESFATERSSRFRSNEVFQLIFFSEMRSEHWKMRIVKNASDKACRLVRISLRDLCHLPKRRILLASVKSMYNFTRKKKVGNLLEVRWLARKKEDVKIYAKENFLSKVAKRQNYSIEISIEMRCV